MSEIEPEPESAAPTAANDTAPAAEATALAGPFPALVVGEETIGCDHLKEFTFVFDTPQRKGVHGVVQFSTHCFSDRYDPDRHDEHIVVVDERGQPRCFDRDRYELSKGLEALIRGLPGSKVYLTPEANFAIITMQDGREYRVFFKARKMAKNKVRIYVESAYAPDPARFKVLPPTAFQKVRFVILVDKRLSGQPIDFKGR